MLELSGIDIIPTAPQQPTQTKQMEAPKQPALSQQTESVLPTAQQ
jgi:hypothetical protein